MEIEKWKERFLRIETSGFKKDNVIWASELKRNGLYKIDLEKEKIEFISRLPVDEGNWLFLDIVNEAEKLFFVPFNAHELVIYNLYTGHFRTIEVKGVIEEKYAFGSIYSGSVYLFPDIGNRIAKVDIRTKRVVYIEDVFKDLKANFSIDHLFFAHYLYEAGIYMPLYHKNIVVKFNYKTEKCESYVMNECENIGFFDCFGKNELLFLLDRYGTVYEFDLHTKKIRNIFSMKDGTIEPYSAICLYKDEIWLIPFKKKQIAIYNMQNGEKTFLDISLGKYIVDQSGEEFAQGNRIMFSKVFAENGKLWMYPKDIEWIVEVDMETRKMKGFQAFLPVERNRSLSGYIARAGGEMSPKENDKKNIGRDIYLAVNESITN